MAGVSSSGSEIRARGILRDRQPAAHYAPFVSERFGGRAGAQRLVTVLRFSIV